MPTKPFYQSLTLWSGLALLILAKLKTYGVDLSDQQVPLVAAFGKLLKDLPPVVSDIGSLVALFGVIIGRARAHNAKITLLPSTPIPPTTSAVRNIVGLVAAVTLVSVLTGCAGTLPSQFANLNPPLSAGDTKLVEGLADFDTPAALLSIETGSGTVTSIGMYTLIKQTSTMDSDGLLLYGSGQEMQALSSGNVGSLTAVDDILAGAKANASTTQSVNNYATIAQGIDGLLGAAKSYVTNAAASATNPSVASYALTVFTDDVHAAGKGIDDVTAQYAPVTPALTFALPPQPAWHLHLLAFDR